MDTWQYIVIVVVLLIIALAIVKMNKKDVKLEFNKLVELLGGKDNILDTEVDMSRFTKSEISIRKQKATFSRFITFIAINVIM